MFITKVILITLLTFITKITKITFITVIRKRRSDSLSLGYMSVFFSADYIITRPYKLLWPPEGLYTQANAP